MNRRKTTKNIKEIELIDILNNLPDIIPLDCEKEFLDKEYDIFFCPLGFEDRCLTIPEKLAEVKGFRCKESLIFEYSTNLEDNEVNKPRLIDAIKKFSNDWKFIQCDTDDFTNELREYLNRLVRNKNNPNVIFDISASSSKLLLSVMKVLLEYDISLHIVYSEALIYHPTWEEYKKEPKKWTTEEGFGITQGVGKVIPSPEYPGARRENPDMVIVFTTFKPERIKAIITNIDETLLIRPNKRIIWIVGDPHMDEDNKKKRKNITREIIRQILKEVPSSYKPYEVEVCTFNYKETLKALEHIYINKELEYHINICALGSKMQSLGISLFCFIRPDISVYFALPQKFNPNQYSEGCRDTWQIGFGCLINIKSILNRVDQLEIVKEL